jgi:hypothetical protein
MTSDNPFTVFAETLAPASKPRREGVSARAATRREKALQENDCLSQAHRRWGKEAVDALLNGPHGADARTLIDFINGMELSDASDPIARVSSGPCIDIAQFETVGEATDRLDVRVQSTLSNNGERT